jgi:hypothetical protein
MTAVPTLSRRRRAVVAEDEGEDTRCAWRAMVLPSDRGSAGKAAARHPAAAAARERLAAGPWAARDRMSGGQRGGGHAEVLWRRGENES